MALLLVPELIAFSRPVSPARFERVSWEWWTPLVAGHRMIVAMFVAAAISAVLFGWDSLTDQFRSTLEAPTKTTLTGPHGWVSI